MAVGIRVKKSAVLSLLRTLAKSYLFLSLSLAIFLSRHLSLYINQYILVSQEARIT